MRTVDLFYQDKCRVRLEMDGETLKKVSVCGVNDTVDKYKEVKTGFEDKEVKMKDLEKVLEAACKKSKITKQFCEDLNYVKQELMSAPDDVKRAFNNIVKYFSTL
jgi:hypothetical protein